MGPLYQQAGDNINLLVAPQRQLLPGDRGQDFGLAGGFLSAMACGSSLVRCTAPRNPPRSKNELAKIIFSMIAI